MALFAYYTPAWASKAVRSEMPDCLKREYLGTLALATKQAL